MTLSNDTRNGTNVTHLIHYAQLLDLPLAEVGRVENVLASN